MKRKIIQIADSTQLVSLPRKWAQKYNLKKGDEIDVIEDGSRIIIGTDNSLNTGSIKVDITGLDRTTAIYYIQLIYRRGYDEVHINYGTPKAKHLRLDKDIITLAVIQKALNRLPGFELIQQKDDYCLIKNLQENSIKEFDTAIRRVFLILAEAYDNFIAGVKSNNIHLVESIEINNKTIARFINYCLRLLNKKGLNTGIDSVVMYNILSNLDKIMDILKYTARDFLAYGKPIRKETSAIFEMVNNSIQIYHSYFFAYDIKKVSQLYKNRDDTIKKIKASLKKLPAEEVSLIVDFEHALEILVENTINRISLETHPTIVSNS